MSDYAVACAFLENRVNYERFHHISDADREFKLDRMRKLAELLGNPQHRLPIVHVAGTKGKGSTAAMIESILRSAGYRTGMFTSPHLQRVEERIALDGQPCSPEEFTAFLDRVRPAVEALDCEAAAADPPEIGPTYFEILTAMALAAFADRSVQAAVLEVGLGGRLDSTNICIPRISVITSISRDHTQQLGETLESIAREKGGIIKPGVPVVSGATAEPPRRALREIARQTGSTLYELGRDFNYRYSPLPLGEGSGVRADFSAQGPHPNPLRAPRSGRGAGTATRLDVCSMNQQPAWNYAGLTLPLFGRHQAANAAVAVAAVKELQRQGWSIPEPAIAAGLARTTLPARIEVLRRNPVVIVDSAHNPASIEALIEALSQSFSVRRRWLLFASTRDKDVTEMLARLLAFFEEAVFTQYTTNPRALPAADLAARAAAMSGRSFPYYPTPAEAWQTVRRQAAPDDLICITGSFFLAGEMEMILAGEE
ncbi:MAG: bifunctional folylpolyglutamate synthase/dihydrofolate synthase [Pirellulales bacterium]|nr:bifunctional folylpolyglutamate synthase/dihydrofolate synthase [Pirellulales bacterium]